MRRKERKGRERGKAFALSPQFYLFFIQKQDFKVNGGLSFLIKYFLFPILFLFV